MKKQKNYVLLKLAGVIALALFVVNLMSSPSDQSIRNRVMLLSSDKGACSGEQVRAPSGIDYVLTAGHCRILEENGSVKVRTEDGKEMIRKVVAEDLNSDLLLLEGVPNVRGLDVAQYSLRFDHMRAFTHGHALATYETQGFYIQRVEVKVPERIAPLGQLESCDGPKHKIIDDLEDNASICALDVFETASTVAIAPGSSGGPIVNDNGQLVGVASASDGFFGYLVSLTDIRLFLRNY